GTGGYQSQSKRHQLNQQAVRPWLQPVVPFGTESQPMFEISSRVRYLIAAHVRDIHPRSALYRRPTFEMSTNVRVAGAG
ncbi:MAG: hypothetical protein WCK86_19410, partial [Planctomycetia bacterium]